MNEIPLDDQKEFEAWLVARWAEKDELMDEFFETGKFPSDLEGSIPCDSSDEDQKIAAAHGYVETDVKLGHWTEIGQIFMVLAAVALVLKIFKLLFTGA